MEFHQLFVGTGNAGDYRSRRDRNKRYQQFVKFNPFQRLIGIGSQKSLTFKNTTTNQGLVNIIINKLFNQQVIMIKTTVLLTRNVKHLKFQTLRFVSRKLTAIFNLFHIYTLVTSLVFQTFSNKNNGSF